MTTETHEIAESLWDRIWPPLVGCTLGILLGTVLMVAGLSWWFNA